MTNNFTVELSQYSRSGKMLAHTILKTAESLDEARSIADQLLLNENNSYFSLEICERGHGNLGPTHRPLIREIETRKAEHVSLARTGKILVTTNA